MELVELRVRAEAETVVNVRSVCHSPSVVKNSDLPIGCHDRTRSKQQQRKLNSLVKTRARSEQTLVRTDRSLPPRKEVSRMTVISLAASELT